MLFKLIIDFFFLKAWRFANLENGEFSQIALEFEMLQILEFQTLFWDWHLRNSKTRIHGILLVRQTLIYLHMRTTGWEKNCRKLYIIVIWTEILFSPSFLLIKTVGSLLFPPSWSHLQTHLRPFTPWIRFPLLWFVSFLGIH